MQTASKGTLYSLPVEGGIAEFLLGDPDCEEPFVLSNLGGLNNCCGIPGSLGISNLSISLVNHSLRSGIAVSNIAVLLGKG